MKPDLLLPILNTVGTDRVSSFRDAGEFPDDVSDEVIAGWIHTIDNFIGDRIPDDYEIIIAKFISAVLALIEKIKEDK